MTTKTVNVNGKRRARHFSRPSVTLPRLSPGEGLRSVGEEIIPLERAAVRLVVAAALCGLPAVSTGDTEASDHEAGGGPSVYIFRCIFELQGLIIFRASGAIRIMA